MIKFDFTYNDYQDFLIKCPFSEEEKQILEYRRKGKSIVEISMILNLSERTVSRRVKSIYKKILKEI